MRVYRWAALGADIREVGNKVSKIPWQKVIQNKNIRRTQSALSIARVMRSRRNVQWLN